MGWPGGGLDTLQLAKKRGRADGMPKDREELQGLLNGAYNKGRDDIHALYQSGVPMTLLRSELERTREELAQKIEQVERFRTGAVRMGLDGCVYFEPYVKLLRDEIDRQREELARVRTSELAAAYDELKVLEPCYQSIRTHWIKGDKIFGDMALARERVEKFRAALEWKEDA